MFNHLLLMKRNVTLIFLITLLQISIVSAQFSKDATVPISATVNSSPLGITLNWSNPTASNLLILRHTKGNPPNVWTQVLNVTNSTLTSGVDASVSPGQTYEYLIQRVTTINSFGYAHVSVNAPVVDTRGKILIFVDSTTADALGVEFVRLKNDMRGDGWEAIPLKVGPSATPQSVKAEIVSRYNADPANVKAVFLIGRVPIPYSGNTNWDGHAEHRGAWPCDNYYADVNGVWTDNSVNNTTPARAANVNIPGDGKFDQSVMPSAAELQVGRLDFRRLTVGTFGLSEIELLRRYLDKNHNFRTKQYVVANKAIIDDNFGYFSGEAFGANGFRNAYPVVGESNIVQADFFNNTNPDTYLLGYGCGGGWYSGASEVGSSTNFGVDTVNVVFSNLFGSYFGDWDYETDPFMPSALASKGGILTCGWAGRPHFFLQALASGETIGYCMQETQNAQYNSGFFGSYGESGAHVALLGDPTLRAQVVAPPSNVTLEQQCANVKINWTAASDPSIQGYHIYRSTGIGGPYNRLNSAVVIGTTYTDIASIPSSDTLFYQVRAIKQEQTPGGGIFLNNSVGPIAYLAAKAPNPPSLSTLSSTLTCAQPAINISVQSSLTATAYNWTGPGNFNSTLQNPEVTAPGSYTVTVTADNGCTNAASLAVSQNAQGPNIAISGAAELTCSVTSVTLTVGSNLSLIPPIVWTGPNGFTATGNSIIVSQPGVYMVTGTAQSTGCSSTVSFAVQQNTVPPDASATGLSLDCNNISGSIQGNSSTVGVNFNWSGPGGFTSTLQNPQATQPGDYFLTVTNPINGCASTATASITQDVTPPNVSIVGDGLITCATPLVTLAANSTTVGVTFNWTGPNGFTSSGPTAIATTGGAYTVSATAPNGCTSTTSRTIESDGSVPVVQASGGTLTCLVTNITLQGSVNQPNATVAWTGPNGFTSSIANPSVTEPGPYTFTAVAPNGCSAAATVSVLTDLVQPQISVAPPNVLTCNNPSQILQATSSGPNTVTYFWTGPNGFTSDVSNPVVTGAGTYVVNASGSNGCVTTASVVVLADFTIPQLNILPLGTLTCSEPCIQLQPIPSGIIITPSEICQPGTYTITATGQNGCSSTTTFTASEAPPLTTSFEGIVVDCVEPLTISANVQGGTPPYVYNWSTGDQGSTVTLPNTAGSYSIGLTVTDAAGCVNTVAPITIVIPNPLVSTITATNASGPNVADGTVLVAGNGGVFPYTYIWENGATTAARQNLLPGLYSCTITDARGCTTVVSGTVGFTIGTTEFDVVRNLFLSPNPTSSLALLNIRLVESSTVSISVFDPTGRLIWEKPAFEMLESVVQIDLSTQAAGMYSVSIHINNQLITRKIAVIR